MPTLFHYSVVILPARVSPFYQPKKVTDMKHGNLFMIHSRKAGFSFLWDLCLSAMALKLSKYEK